MDGYSLSYVVATRRAAGFACRIKNAEEEELSAFALCATVLIDACSTDLCTQMHGILKPGSCFKNWLKSVN